MDRDERDQALRRARLDQSETAPRDLAAHLTTYYAALLSGGLAPEQALVVVLQWHALFWSRQFAESGAA